jgi:ABC-2 type transport system ATP-binding protein
VQLQEVVLHDALTVAELVDLYRSFYPDPRPADELLAMVELDAQRRTRFSDLSGGQQQRLSIALALVGRPRVVILDELTTGLDPAARRRIWRTVESLETEAVLLVSHAMDEVERLCDRIVLLDAGKVIASGTPAEVTAHAGAATLEDAFVALTGKQLEHEEETA